MVWGQSPHLKGGAGGQSPPSLSCFCAYIVAVEAFQPLLILPTQNPGSHLWSPVLRDYLIVTNDFIFYCDKY